MNQREEDKTSVATVLPLILMFLMCVPLALMAVSMAIFLGWQDTAAAKQYVSLIRMEEQQTILSGQAAQAEGKLQALMMDLLKLSKTDASARAIVEKYDIKFNPPAMPPARPVGTLMPQPRPQLKAAAGKVPGPPEETPGTDTAESRDAK